MKRATQLRYRVIRCVSIYHMHGPAISQQDSLLLATWLRINIIRITIELTAPVLLSYAQSEYGRCLSLFERRDA